MKLFTEDSSLKSMNAILVNQIPKYQLLGDIPLSERDFNHLASRIQLIYGENLNKKMRDLFEESIAVFIVFCAVYEYGNRVFWGQVENHLGELNNYGRMELSSIFSRVLTRYALDQFENESDEGYKYVTPILCHAGIPIHALDNYFAGISNTVNDSFYDDFDVDDYLSYLKNKTEISVKRYIKLANKRDSFNFIQNTRKLIQSDSVDSDEELDSGNYLRMIDQISIWKEKPKIKKNLQARSNVQITAPKIKINLDGVGIYCDIPRIIVKDCYDSYIVWEISSDENHNFVKADFIRRSGVLVSEEKIIPLRPAEIYTISLKVDDNLISKWEFDGVKENLFAFSENGNAIKTEFLPNTSVILLLKKKVDIIGKESLSVMELPQIPLWNEFNVYRIDLYDLKVLPCTGFNIRIHSETKPIIEGGRTLFHQENSRAYVDLPYIKVPLINEGEWHIEIKHKAENVINKTNEVISSDCERILLSSLIPKGFYGNYEIKIWNRSGINGKFSIDYVPNGRIQVEDNYYWPSSYQGYLYNILVVRTSLAVAIEAFNAEKVSEIVQKDSIVHRFKVNENERFLIGDYKYIFNGFEYSTPIKKSIHPISWGMVGITNDIIAYSSKVYTLTLQDFTNATDPFILFSFDFNDADNIQNLTIDLVRADRTIVLSNSQSLINKDGLRIPLNSFLLEVSNTRDEEIDYHLRVSLFDSNNIRVTSFLLARIQEEVVIKNADFSQNDGDILITWEETGTGCGRECVMFNFLKPWVSPYHFKVEDKKCEINIDYSILEEGVYKYLIQKESVDLFFDDTEAEICSLRDFQKQLIVVKGEQIFSTDLERILYKIMRTRFTKKEKIPQRLRKIESEINSLNVMVPVDIHPLVNAYVLHNRFYANKEDVSEVMKLFNMLFELFANFGKETIRYILESDLSNQFKMELLHKFHCNNLTSVTRLSDSQLNLLLEIDRDMAGFIILIQTENNSRGLNWAGISDIGVLREVDLFEDGNDAGTFLSDENLGEASYIKDYFQYVCNCLQRPKNITKTSDDFLKEFQRNHSVQETKIFGKTKLHLLAEWKEKNRDSATVKERLADVISIPCNNELKHEFADAFQALSKRKRDDELGYYIGLVALYASFIRNGLMIEKKEISRLLHYTIEKCEKLYYRDAIIIELYMHLERGYSWV